MMVVPLARGPAIRRWLLLLLVIVGTTALFLEREIPIRTQHPDSLTSNTELVLQQPDPDPQEPSGAGGATVVDDDQDFAIVGEVRHQIDFTAIEHAEISISDSTGNVVAETLTDVDGCFHFSLAPRYWNWNLELVVRASGLIPVEVARYPGVEDLGVIYVVDGAVLHGRVVFENGQPVPGGHGNQVIDVMHLPDGTPRDPGARYSGFRTIPFEIDEEGTFECTFAAPTIAIEVFGERFMPRFTLPVFRSDRDRQVMTIVVRRGQVLNGVVQDWVGSPVPNVTVTCRPACTGTVGPRFARHHGKLVAISDEHGEFVLSGLSDTAAEVVARSEHLGQASVHDWATNEFLTLSLCRGTSIKGALRDSHDGPVSTVVTIWNGKTAVRAQSDSRGRFESPLLYLASRKLTLSPEGCDPIRIELPVVEPGSGAIDLGALDVSWTHYGKLFVVDERRNPVPSPHVTVQSAWNTRRRVIIGDSGGAVDVPYWFGRGVDVIVSAAGFGTRRQRLEPASEESDPPTVVLEDATEIRGMIVNEAFVGVPWAEVAASPSDNSTWSSASSNREGVFVLRGLPETSVGTLWISVRHPRYAERTVRSDGLLAPIVLQELIELQGFVLLEDGRPASETSIVLNRRRADGAIHATTTANGSYRLWAAPGESIRIDAYKEGFMADSLTWTADVESANVPTIRMRPETRYEGVLVTTSGTPLQGARMEFWSSSDSSRVVAIIAGERGRVLAAGVPETDIHVRVVSRDLGIRHESKYEHLLDVPSVFQIEPERPQLLIRVGGEMESIVVTLKSSTSKITRRLTRDGTNFALRGLPKGQYELRIATPSGRQSSAYHVAIGDHESEIVNVEFERLP